MLSTKGGVSAYKLGDSRMLIVSSKNISYVMSTLVVVLNAVNCSLGVF